MANSGDAEQLYPSTGNAEDSFYDSIGDGTSPEYDNAVNNSLPTTPVDPEERARQEEEWRKELAKLEDEILTLRQVLSAKVRQSGELKRKLGITPMVELKQDLKQGITNIKETDAYKKTNEKLTQFKSTQAYQKTNQTLKTAGQKTASAFSSLGSFTSSKLGAMRNSTAFKSFEEKVGGAVSNVKEYVGVKKPEDGTEMKPSAAGDAAGGDGSTGTSPADSGFHSPADGAPKQPLVSATDSNANKA